MQWVAELNNHVCIERAKIQPIKEIFRIEWANEGLKQHILHGYMPTLTASTSLRHCRVQCIKQHKLQDSDVLKTYKCVFSGVPSPHRTKHQAQARWYIYQHGNAYLNVRSITPSKYRAQLPAPIKVQTKTLYAESDAM